MLDEARRGLDRVGPTQLEDELAGGALVVDTRPLEQRRRDGVLPGALVLDRNVLEWRLDPSNPDSIREMNDAARRIVVVCNEGYSSSLAAASLRQLGLSQATDLAGGFQAWRRANDSRRRERVETHWDEVYGSGPTTEVSWFEEQPTASLALVDAVGAGSDHAVIDVGGGASVLVDALEARGFRDLTVLDVSGAALRAAQRRLGPEAGKVNWVHEDVLTWRPPRRYAVWHDRAVFHFLVETADRELYLAVLRRALATGGAAIIGTFAEDGSHQCSGLPVARYSPEELAAAIGPGFERVAEQREEHRTPVGAVQPFTWLALRRTEP